MEGRAGEPGVTREDMLQIKSFGTKEDCCQATQPERGYRGNRADPKLDLRNEVALVVRGHTHTRERTNRRPLLPPPSLLSPCLSRSSDVSHRKCRNTEAQSFNQGWAGESQRVDG